MGACTELDPTKVTAADIRKFVSQVSNNYLLDRPHKHGTERRSAQRLAVTMPATVIPLDKHFEPMDYKVNAISRDLSSLGIGLVTTSPLMEGNVLVSIEPYFSDAFTVPARVVYCTDLGYYFQIGCEFGWPLVSPDTEN